MVLHDGGDSLGDGLGQRIVRADDGGGRIEVLTVADPLATAASEQAIRARAAALADLPSTIVAPVRLVERREARLEISAPSIEGARLSTLLEQLRSGSVTLADEAVLQLIARMVRSVAAFHGAPARLAHGAITPAHFVLSGRDMVLTDAVFGASLQALPWNRETMWRTFGIALPPAANLVRFDQRTDVCELAAVAVALVLRRPLTADEYPRHAGALAAAAAERLGGVTSAIRMWLQQALQLQSRATFASAIDAGQALAELLEASTGRRSVQRMLGTVAGPVPSAVVRTHPA